MNYQLNENDRVQLYKDKKNSQIQQINEKSISMA